MAVSFDGTITYLFGGVQAMISIGIDVSKGSSVFCIMENGNILHQGSLIHSRGDMEQFTTLLRSLDNQFKVVLEATGIYHLPILHHLKQSGFFVAVINPLILKKYAALSLRKVKTDKLDAVKIADYGLSHWHKLTDYSFSQEVYAQLKDLGRSYAQYIKLKVIQKQYLTVLLDKAMPGITVLVRGCSHDDLGNEKLLDFVEHFRHFDFITAKSEKQFVQQYCRWAKKKGYQPSQAKAYAIYELAKTSIPTSSSKLTPTTVLILETVKILRQLCKTLQLILTQMSEIAEDLPEYEIVRAMPGVGKILAVRLIAEIGDVRRFHSGKSLIAFAGIDSPSYESGQFVGTKRNISKRGSSLLRKTGFEVMKAVMIHKPQEDNAVYLFMVKKELEGKAKKVARIAGLNKFLRIYYARVKQIYDAG